jgi:hypothetical protein
MKRKINQGGLSMPKERFREDHRWIIHHEVDAQEFGSLVNTRLSSMSSMSSWGCHWRISIDRSLSKMER